MSLRDSMKKGPLSIEELDSSSASSSSGSIMQDKSGDGNEMIAFMDSNNKADKSHGSHGSGMLVDMMSVGSKGSKKYPCNVPNALRRSNSNVKFKSSSPY